MMKLYKLLRKQTVIVGLTIAVLISVAGCVQEAAMKNETVREQSQAPDEGVQNEENNGVTINRVDFSGNFNGINGCAVLFDFKDNQYSVYNEGLAVMQASPYSTFKIISALMGIHADVIESQASTMNYNGTQYPVPEWNDNLSLDKAFNTSCVWFFRQVIDAVGEGSVQQGLEELQYGNCDISEWRGSGANGMEELNGFWLNSSLKISPMEQVQVLSAIFEGESIYSANEVIILKDIMYIEDVNGKKIYGKTGTGADGEAWFVGFAEKNDEREYFAIYLNDNNQSETVSGNAAKAIAIEIIHYIR